MSLPDLSAMRTALRMPPNLQRIEAMVEADDSLRMTNHQAKTPTKLPGIKENNNFSFTKQATENLHLVTKIFQLKEKIKIYIFKSFEMRTANQIQDVKYCWILTF